MSTDDSPERERGDQPVESEEPQGDGEELNPDVRERLEEGADRAIDQFDEGLIDLLAWMLETETRARIYIALRKRPEQTSDELAENTGLYPSTVREALASLHEDGIVVREKRQNAGAGNNPYEYSAIPPSDLVGEIVEDIQEQLNRVFNLDKYIDRTESEDDGDDPVTITVTEHTESEDDEAESDESDGGDDLWAGHSEGEATDSEDQEDASDDQ